jgi:sugar transferase (PEP-CTERM/EpsH1 system associated)
LRILYLCHRIPYPPNKGDKIRAFHQLQAMGQQHEIDLFTLADDRADWSHRLALLKHCRTVSLANLRPVLSKVLSLPYLLTTTPLTVPCFRSLTLHKRVQQALQKHSYDRIFVYSSSMAQYVAAVRNIPIILDLVDVDSDKWRQYATFTKFPVSAVYRREAQTLKTYERSACRQASCVLVSTEREAQLIREDAGNTPVHVVMNGVDANVFSPALEPTSQPGRPRVVFTGDMSYFPNAQAVMFFALKVLPLVRKSVPAVQFIVIGRNPTADVRRLASMEGVTVTGFVPDVRAYLAQAQVAVAPFLVAAGIQNKILEAMACGVPVVGTGRAIQGLVPSVAELVSTGETAEEIARCVIELLRDDVAARRKGMECRKRVIADYDWGQSMRQLLQLVEARTCVPAAMMR